MKKFFGCMYRLLWYTDFLELAVLKIFVCVLLNTLKYHLYHLTEHVIYVDPSWNGNLLFIVCWPVAVFFIWNWSANEPTFSFSVILCIQFFPLCRFPQYRNPHITLYYIFTNKYNNLHLLHPAYGTGLSSFSDLL